MKAIVSLTALALAIGGGTAAGAQGVATDPATVVPAPSVPAASAVEAGPAAPQATAAPAPAMPAANDAGAPPPTPAAAYNAAGAAATAAPGDPPDAAAALAAASADTDTLAPAEKDPLEKFNRTMWGLNMGFDKVIAKPVSTVYRKVTPRFARRGVSNVLSNLTEPWSFVNGLLQGNPKRAFNSFGRFLINSTLGLGGLIDQASREGLQPTPEDFGQTLAKWGVKSGPYLVLPLLGPSTIRDGVGTGVAFFADPYQIALRESGLTRTQRYGITAFSIVSARADLTESGGDTFLSTSLDPYAAARSAYLQRREQAIRNEDGGGGATPAGTAGTGDAALDAAVSDIKSEQGGSAAPATAPPEAPNSPAPPPRPN